MPGSWRSCVPGPGGEQPVLPGDDYQWQHTIAHLVAARAAGDADDRDQIDDWLGALLGSFEYLVGRITVGGVDALITDVHVSGPVPPPHELRLVALARLLGRV